MTALRRDAARMLRATCLVPKAAALPVKALWRIEATTFVAERPVKTVAVGTAAPQGRKGRARSAKSTPAKATE